MCWLYRDTEMATIHAVPTRETNRWGSAIQGSGCPSRGHSKGRRGSWWAWPKVNEQNFCHFSRIKDTQSAIYRYYLLYAATKDVLNALWGIVNEIGNCKWNQRKANLFWFQICDAQHQVMCYQHWANATIIKLQHCLSFHKISYIPLSYKDNP